MVLNSERQQWQLFYRSHGPSSRTRLCLIRFSAVSWLNKADVKQSIEHVDAPSLHLQLFVFVSDKCPNIDTGSSGNFHHLNPALITFLRCFILSLMSCDTLPICRYLTRDLWGQSDWPRLLFCDWLSEDSLVQVKCHFWSRLKSQFLLVKVSMNGGVEWRVGVWPALIGPDARGCHDDGF